MTDPPYDPGPLPAAAEPAGPGVSPAVMTAARTAYLTFIAAGRHPVDAVERAVTVALTTATEEVYAVLVEQGIDERTRRAEARLAKAIETAQAWASSGTPDQRKAGRMLLVDLHR